MSLIFRLNNFDLPCKDFNIDFTQNAITQFTATVPRAHIAGITNLYFLDAAIIKDGVTLVSGIAYDEEITVDEYGTLFSKIYCYDELGRLLNEPPLINPENAAIGHFQDEQLLGIIMLLLSGTTTFRVGFFTTMIDPLIRVTVDLRNLDTRWAQIIKTVGQVQNCFVRYGGFDSGSSRHTLDIGAFGQKYVDQSDEANITIFSVNRMKSRFEVVRDMIAVGGTMATVPQRPVFLSDALAYDPTLATHPSFPIVTLALNTLAVRNNAVSSGAGRKKDFPNVKTRNDVAPTAAEIREAGYSLWQAAVAELQKKSNEAYKVVGKFRVIPKIGDVLKVNGQAYQSIINPVTMQAEDVATFSVNGNYYIQKVDTSFNNEIEISELTIGSSRYANEGDNEIDIYNEIDQRDGTGVATSALTYAIAIGSQAQGPGVAANCTQYVVGVGSVNGRSFSVALPAPPVGATFVTFAIASNPIGATVATTQVPALPATGWSGCVSINNNWTTANSATITIVFLFT